MVAAGAPTAPSSRRFMVFLLAMSGTIAGAPAAITLTAALLPVLPVLPEELTPPFLPLVPAPPLAILVVPAILLPPSLSLPRRLPPSLPRSSSAANWIAPGSITP